jgi:hypothetical protein
LGGTLSDTTPPLESPFDWAEASESFDALKRMVAELDLASTNEAQTRFQVIDRFITEVLGWHREHVKVEEATSGQHRGFIDYVLRVGDATLVIEAKRAGSAFPSPTQKGRLKLNGSVLADGPIGAAIAQAEEYAQAQNADALCVTNGLCWCYFSLRDRDDDSRANLLFPFKTTPHAAQLFRELSEPVVRAGSLNVLSNREPQQEDRLLSILKDADGRVDRNNIADHITPALSEALHADALLSNQDALEKCFIPTEGRSKFDSLLGMHLADPKPQTASPAPRIKTGQRHGPLEEMVDAAIPQHAPPVTLILGPVGAGKSTYLKHFELISGREVLERRGAHWIYIDFAKMGQAAEARSFIYSKLRDYLLQVEPSQRTNYNSLVEPAYREFVNELARGPLARVYGDKVEFNRRVTDYIQHEFEAVEPYVDRLFAYLAKTSLCVIILDNIDLFEDDELETHVFAEGLALSKRMYANVLVSLRDTTFVRHRNSAEFNAYELHKLWLDPPPFRAVLAARFAYSRKILKGRSAKVMLANGMELAVPDLGVFFEIVQRSVLGGTAGFYVEAMSDLNIRRGLSLVYNFLTSGHIQADRALQSYIDGDIEYYFPFHEVFKGTALGQWRHYEERRAECINVFDARTGTNRGRLLRVAILGHLAEKARHDNTVEVSVAECIDLFGRCGASAGDVLAVLGFLQENSLIRTATAAVVSLAQQVSISRSGGYYLKQLCRTFVYVEACMLDTAIEDPSVWQRLSELTHQIEATRAVGPRMVVRQTRVAAFMDYLSGLEQLMLDGASGLDHLRLLGPISEEVKKDAARAVRGASRSHSD